MLFLLLHCAACARGDGKQPGGGGTHSLLLERSFDLGSTWQVHSKPISSMETLFASSPTFPSSSSVILLRIHNTQAPMIEIPPCAVMSPSLRVTAWLNEASPSASPFALSWASEHCHDGDGIDTAADEGIVMDDDETTDTSGIVVQRRVVSRGVQPRWADYVSEQRVLDGKGSGGSSVIEDLEEELKKQGLFGKDKKQKKSWFAKYGLYIGLFVVFALAQGIKQGLNELQEENRRQEAAQQQQQQLTAGASSSLAGVRAGQSQGLRRPTKANLRARRKGGKSASSSSGGSRSSAK